jgi:N-acetylglucosaminyl-diphospho-decaprenol L-rhamnosyltransferase
MINQPLDLSISIVSTNERRYIEPMLPTLYQSVRDITFEVVLIDNASTDGLVELAKLYDKLQIIRNDKRLSFCANHNFGICASKGRYVLVLNPDVLFDIEEPCLDKMVQFMDQHPECGVSGCRVYNFDKEFAYPARHFFDWRIILARRLPRLFESDNIIDKYLYRSKDIYSTFECDWLSGCFLFFRKSALDQVGLFDLGYPKYFEDVDICYRMKKAGWKVYYCGDTYYYHLEQRASKKLFTMDAWKHIRSYIHWKAKYWGQ